MNIPTCRIVVDNGVRPSWMRLELGLHQSAEIGQGFVTKSAA